MKKIGLFIGQIYLDSQRKVIQSVHEECKKNNIDCTIFSFFSSNEEMSNQGEFEYINRINMDSYDGFILYAETIYSDELRARLIEKIKTFNKHIVSIDYDIKIGPNIKTDNYYAMKEMTEHLIEEHNIKKVNFIAGPIDSTDSKFRLRGVTRVLEKNGIKVDQDRIFFGDFLPDSGSMAIQYYLKNGLLDADVYICANDQMALGAYNELTNLGMKIPEDCLLTGFDNIDHAKKHLPSITSVERREDYIGRIAFEKLTELIEGKKVEDELVKAKPIIRKSSRPSYQELSADELIEEYQNFGKENIENSKFSRAVNDSSSEFIAAKSIEDLVNLLPKHLRNLDVTEFCLVIDDNSGDLKIPLHYIKSNNTSYGEIISKKEVLPEFKSTESGNLSIIIPLHYLDCYYGYIITNNYEAPLYKELFRSFINNISNSLEAIRIYQKTLQENLTKLLTRDGFEYYGEKQFKKSKELNEPMFILFSDLDGLKTVNDHLGHEAGDAFIKSYADILTKVNKKYGFIIMRYGGDEFVVFGYNANREIAETFKKEVEAEIEQTNSKNKSIYAPYILSSSMGIEVIDNTSDLSLSDYISEADKDMYIKKKEKKKSQEVL